MTKPLEISITHSVVTPENVESILYGLLHSFVNIAASNPDAKVEEWAARASIGMLTRHLPANSAPISDVDAAGINGGFNACMFRQTCRALVDWHKAALEACMVRESCYEPSDPRKTLQNLLSWEAKAALDPAISEEAQELIERGKRMVAGATNDLAKTHPQTAGWPMLTDTHLESLILAYNEGYSKGYEGREFKNPFARSGSQAAAWERGTRDGKENRKRDGK
jgi:hypothetical protein